MTRHEAQALVITAVGDLPMVTRIDYVVDGGGQGVVVTVVGEQCAAIRHERLAEMTVEEYRTHFLAIYANTVRWEAQQAEQARTEEA